MRFVSQYDYKNVKEELSISEIVERELCYSYNEGALEHLERKVFKLTYLLTLLLEEAPESVQKDIASSYAYDIANK